MKCASTIIALFLPYQVFSRLDVEVCMHFYETFLALPACIFHISPTSTLKNSESQARFHKDAIVDRLRRVSANRGGILAYSSTKIFFSQKADVLVLVCPTVRKSRSLGPTSFLHSLNCCQPRHALRSVIKKLLLHDDGGWGE